MSSALWQWDSSRLRALRRAARDRPGDLPSPLRQWEAEQEPPWRRRLGRVGSALRRPLRAVALAGFAFILGARVVSGPEAALAGLDLRRQLAAAEMAVKARQGELELTRLEVARLETILTNSARYRIPADLAAAIYDIALAEGVEPELAFRLVRTESGFSSRAISPVGAVGLTQVMPATARGLAPGISYEDLFDRETNLRLGFRYLRELLARYDGDLRLALLAYNRGPTRVDSIRRAGGDPSNGYARTVLGPSGAAQP